ncbi:unnamed protein product [marine sediment metagenome]|uniref:Uncharacterized protein n=1 Tax=marine sediment metagenome TaxID=412755 RepID=X0RPH7_9ZZZZ
MSKILFLLMVAPLTLLAGDLYTSQTPTPYQYQDYQRAAQQMRLRERDTQQDLDRLYKDYNWDWSKRRGSDYGLDPNKVR